MGKKHSRIYFVILFLWLHYNSSILYYSHFKIRNHKFFLKILGGWLAYKFGPKIVFLVAMFLGSVGTLLVPILANWSYYSLIFIRIITGAAQVR